MESTEAPTTLVTAEDQIPQCQVTREAPESLRDLLYKQSSGLQRVVVAVVHGRNNSNKLNAIRFTGAKYNRATDNDALEESFNLLMRIVSAHLETSGQAADISFTTWHVDSEGKRERGQYRQIPFDGIYDNFTGVDRNKQEENPEHFEMLRYLTAQNRHSLNLLGSCVSLVDAVTRGVKGQAAYGEVVVGRLSDALVREREATKELGQAQAETTAINNEHAIELAKLKQRGEFMDMMSPAIQHATSQIGVEAAGKLTSGRKKKGDPKAGNPLAAMSKPKPKTEPKPKASDGPPKLEVVDAEVVEDDNAIDREEARLDALKDEHPQTFAAGMLRLSLTEDQETKVKSALGDEAWAAFQRAAGASNNTATLEALVDLWKLAPSEAAAKLLKVMDGSQQGVLGTLRMAVMQHEKNNPRED